MDQGMTMNLTELLAAKAALDAEIAKAKKTEATAALRRVQELVTEFGLTYNQNWKQHGKSRPNQSAFQSLRR